MNNQANNPIPRFTAVQYGSVSFENIDIPCAFGGEPGRFNAFILIEGVCHGIGIDPQGEIERIKENEILAGGLFMVPFASVDEEGQRSVRDFPAITLSRLHTWLALIPSDLAPTEEMRTKLRNMKMELVDVLYGYFGRPLLPPDMRAEEETYLTPSQREFYKKLEEAAELPGRVNQMQGELHDLRDEVKRLTMRFGDLESGEHIDVDQQEQLRAMIGILARKYQEKNGPGTYGDIEKRLQKDHNFHYYKAIRVEEWPGIVRDCVQIYYSLFGRTSRLPRVFEMAQNSANQKSLF